MMLPTSIDYPLFPTAHARYRELQPDPETIAAAMSDAGLAIGAMTSSCPVVADLILQVWSFTELAAPRRLLTYRCVEENEQLGAPL